MTVIFVVAEGEYERAEIAVTSAARDDAFAYGGVQLWMQLSNGELRRKAGGQFVNFEWETVNWGIAMRAFSTSYSIAQLVYSKTVKVPIGQLKANAVTLEPVENSREFFTKQSKHLKRILSVSQLAWRDQVLDNFGHFRHGTHIANAGPGSDRERNWSTVEAWIKQFDDFGARPAAESLARLLVVQRPELLVANSEIGLSLNRQQLPFLASLSGLGKSGGVLLQNAAKYVQQEASGCIGKGMSWYADKNPRGTLHVIEDGLWTGYEFLKVLDALEGKKPHPSIQTLGDPSHLQSVNVRLHFLVATDMGIATLKSILKDRNLNNFDLATSPQYIKVLGAAAQEKFDSGEYTFRHVIDDQIPAAEIEPAILQVQRPWLDESARAAVAKLIEEKAGLLYPVPDKVKAPLHQAWPYGASFIGSHMVFAHSSPRAALPFYWKSGRIIDGRRQIDWNALVPETVEKRKEDAVHV